ncbi:uncharacterized protein LOC133464882 [Cololabis saira]|uniref:uncharacterized protein LOC133464882 n=1 Tax=Cololabis saira TaxID=129043 RepID=UPI002AD45574|nr:uncharacterized protein LOC133464882 [Cololabis saira]
MRKPGKILLWNLLAAAFVLGQTWANVKRGLQSNGGLRSDCAGNLMRLSLDEALAVGNQIEVEAINGTQHILVTPTLAAQCGYSMESDPWGNTRIYMSLLGCYMDNKDDTTFSAGLRVHMYKNSPSDVVSHDVAQTCSYTRWAPKEILCDRNYMEVSYMAKYDQQAEVKGQDDNQFNTIPGESSEAHEIWKMTFYTPEPVVMVLKEAEQAGYSAKTTPSRLVVRSPYNGAETYSEDVAGVPMEVLRVSVYHKDQHGLNVVDLAAACPTGGVLFTDELISWHIPRRVTPLTDGRVKIIELYMGLNGQRLDKSQMAARGYLLSNTDFHIIVEIPVGSPDGYYKSHALDYHYQITYTIEPMLEVLWRAEEVHDETRYKVLFPITTPPMPHPPTTEDRTVPEERIFSVHVGSFLHDVVLQNITFPSGVITVAESNARGFAVQEHILSNGTIVFSLQVPFDADAVLKHNPELLVTNYFLPLEFGFVVLPEGTPFAHTVELQASLQDVVLPSFTGTCDQDRFFITVRYGNQGHNFQTLVGTSFLTPELMEAYNFHENSTHFSIEVPYTAPDTAFQAITTGSVSARLDMLLWDPNNEWVLGDLYLACSFPLLMTECHPNGTITALAVKVESVPNLNPSWLTLRDTTCTPVFSDDRFAHFTFSADSCGTTRTFFGNYMLYENEISLPFDNEKGVAHTSPVDPDYRQTVSCYYVVNDTQTIAFSPKPRRYDPRAEIGSGMFMVQMRLAKDYSYDYFYDIEDYPVEKYLREPLYFEVELVSSDIHFELILENCWATNKEDRTSLPSWDIIVDSCENPDDIYTTVFHPVVVDARVSIPIHYKRFSVKMFTFIQEEKVLKDEIYIHCDVVICDTTSPAEDVCQGQCAHPSMRHQGAKRGLRSPGSTYQKMSSGPVVFNKLFK